MYWNAENYLLFEAERTRPVRDLLAAIPAGHASSITDLGCGPGNSTELLASRFPGATITGIDTAPDMLETARRRLPLVRFHQQDIATWQPATAQDVIFSNAALHWLPDHAGLLPRLAQCLAPGGSLAIQMPDNLEEPSHAAMRAIALDGLWSARLANASEARMPVDSPAAYYEILRPCCARIDIWRTVYILPLQGAAQIAAFYRSTGLRPFLAPLREEERTQFLERYTAAMARDYPALPDGTVLLASPRLFVVARK